MDALQAAVVGNPRDNGSGDPCYDWDRLADRVLAGEELSRAEALDILRAPDVEVPALVAAAFRVRRRHFGLAVQLYYLKNAKSGLCPEDCGYCSQSSVSTADIDRYPLLSEQKLLEGARQAVELNSRTYCIVTSGRGPTDREVDHLARVVEKVKAEYGLHICCCLGLLRDQQARRLKAAGVDRINHNLNTSRRFYDEICSTHTYQDRLDTLRAVREAGLELCSGLIVGMGETHDDVVEVALELKRLAVESIPVNFLIPIAGTPLAARSTGLPTRAAEPDDMCGSGDPHYGGSLDPRYCLKVLCLLRLTNPATEIRIAGGREVHLRSLQAMGLYAANSMFVSDYLTTKGQAPEDDFRMVEDLGFEIVTHHQPEQGASPGGFGGRGAVAALP